MFAKEVLKNKNTTSIEDSLGLTGGHTTSLTHHQSSMKSKLSSMSHRNQVSRTNQSSKKNAYSASLVPSRRDNIMPSVMTEVASTKSARTLRDTQNMHFKNNFVPNLPSHPVGLDIISTLIFYLYFEQKILIKVESFV